MEENNKIVLFQEKRIRRSWHNETWYFSVIDIIETLTDSNIPSRYWSDLKRRVSKESGNDEVYAKCVKLKFLAPDGKVRPTDCADTKTLLRIIQSIPSPKAEPFKNWLAQVGTERIIEIENPELAVERARELYKAKGYPDEWIEERIKGIETRKTLTDEWKNRDVKVGVEYSILTAEIAKATFGLTPSEHSAFKSLKKQNLRDHMTELELIFTRLGELSTRNNAIEEQAQGFQENQKAARKGGLAAGNARKSYEETAGVKVVSPQNFLNLKADEPIQELPDSNVI
jgi:DNA-damage-inducible protein D